MVLGSYRATAPGELEEVNFYDATHYFASKQGCTGGTCVDHGTFAIDAAASRITLRDDASGAETVLSYDPHDVVDLTAQTTPAALRPQAQIGSILGDSTELIQYNCQLLKNIKGPTGLPLKNSQDMATAFQAAVLAELDGAAGSPAGSDAPSWLGPLVDNARRGCGDMFPYPETSSVLDWNSIKLYDVPACGSDPVPTPRGMTHTLYNANGSPVLTAEYLPDNPYLAAHWSTTPIIPPNALVDAQLAACRKSPAMKAK
jgi:hypothetical protein